MEKPKTTPKDFFLYFAGFVTLYVSAISLINLLFSIINKAFPDILTGSYSYSYDYYSTGMRLSIASLIIIFPIYLFLASYINKYLLANPDKRELSIRKWLTYLTLFITGAAVVVDLVILVNTFLGGEITSRFILKVIAVALVSGVVFAYYIYDLRKKFTPDEIVRTKTLVITASIVVLISLIVGFIMMGSPMKARKQRFDDRRINDLQSIQWQIIDYWQSKGELPKDLSFTSDPISGFYSPKDPETGASYKYETTGDYLSFKLCANFSLKSRVDDFDYENALNSKDYAMNKENWAHGIGETCFDRTIDPDIYPYLVK